MNRALIVLSTFLAPLAIFLVGVAAWKGVYYLCLNMLGWDPPGAFMATILVVTGMFAGVALSPTLISISEDKE